MSPAIVTAASNAAQFGAVVRSGVIPTGYVRLTCGDPAISLVVLLGPEAPRITGGVGGWSVINRPREVGMTVWDGVEPYQLALSLMFDGWTGQQSQERAIRSLMRVGRGDRESPPGVLTVEGIPLPARRWVMEGIDYGEPILALDGSRYRQPLTLTLRQYVPPKLLRRRKSAYSSSSKTVILRSIKGDTPAKIAKRRRLKSWTVIRDLNRNLKLKANKVLKTGTKVRVPSTRTTARSGGLDRK